MMIYFKKIEFPYPGKEQTEAALRKAAIKRTTSLDFKSSSTAVGNKKLFMGLDELNDTKFTRIRYFVEGYLPKIIISVPKNDQGKLLKFRLSIVATVVFCLLVLYILTGLVFPNGSSIATEGVTLLAFFILLILLELKLTRSAIDKAIRQFAENNAQ